MAVNDDGADESALPQPARRADTTDSAESADSPGARESAHPADPPRSADTSREPSAERCADAPGTTGSAGTAGTPHPAAAPDSTDAAHSADTDTDGTTTSDDPEPSATTGDSGAENRAHPRTRRGRGKRVLISAAAVAVIAGLTAVTTVLGLDHRTASRQEADRSAYLQAARQAVVNLTTISADHTDADIARILDASTGPFHDDFTSRSAGFTKVVQQAHVSTTGTVTESGIESLSGDQAKVLVAATSKVTNSAGAQEEPRTWRLRLQMQRTQGRILVSTVDFVA